MRVEISRTSEMRKSGKEQKKNEVVVKEQKVGASNKIEVVGKQGVKGRKE